MTGLHVAARMEDAIHARASHMLQHRHWDLRVFPYVGYGSSADTADGGFARVLGRVVIGRKGQPKVPATSPDSPVRRGISAFFSVPEPGRQVQISFGDASVMATTDRGGYFDADLRGHRLPHGWHEARVSCGGIETTASVQVIASHVRFGVVSDIDDTAIITALPRLFIAAWNTFVVRETARREVPGMPMLYRTMMAQNPDAPMFYLSTGAWNTQPVLTRFFRRRGYPTGTMLLTDWGPTETGWFRSGQEHKRRSLRRLAKEFPQIEWLLIGDDGQHDPAIYEEFAREYPDHVKAVAIRQLTPTQQMLSHGHPMQLEQNVDKRVPGVPWVEGHDGYALHERLAAPHILGEPDDLLPPASSAPGSHRVDDDA